LRIKKIFLGPEAHMEELRNAYRIFLGVGGGAGSESTITEATTGLLYQPWLMMDDECGAIGGMFGS
jgi:hypothetical protein